MSILTAVAVLAATGIFIGIFLGIAGIAFHVEENPIEEAILTALPGNNCGGCGFPGCSGLATAIAAGEAKADACPVGGESVATQIAELIGQQIEKTHRKVAYVHCAGQADQTTVKYRYDGPKDCNIMQYVPGGGSKQCSDGCLGYGSCVAACAFDAIRIQNGVAVVIKERCKACGQCVTSCPKKLIEMIDAQTNVTIPCRSTQKGAVTQKACRVGCIGCGICAKICPHDAITVKDNHARITYENCVGCGLCVEKCPKKCIIESKDRFL